MNELLSEQVDILLRAGVISETEAQIKTIEQLDAAIQNTRNSILDIKTETSTWWLDPELENMLNVVHGVGGWNDDTLLNLQNPIEIRKLVSAYNDTLGIFDGYVYGLTVDVEEYTKRVNNYFDAIAERREYEAQKLNESLGFTGNDIASSVVNGIMDGLELSKDGLGEYMDGFQGLMEKATSKALTGIFESEYLYGEDGLMRKFYDALESDGKIDSEEMEALQDDYRDAIVNMKDTANAWAHVIGENTEEAEKDEGMKGDIKGITEKTAGQLEGRINSIQMNVIGLKEINQSQLQTLEAIRQNTSYNFHLEAMASDIDNMRRTQLSMLETMKSNNDNATVTI